MNNVIYNKDDEVIGYYEDLYNMYRNVINDMLKEHNVEEAKAQTEELEELTEHKDYTGLLVLSENNGMGFTCKPYKGEE